VEWKCARDVVCVWTDGDPDREDDQWTRDSLGTTESHAAHLGWRLETFSIQVRMPGSHSDLAVFTYLGGFHPNMKQLYSFVRAIVY
jgi:hypothetical protein